MKFHALGGLLVGVGVLTSIVAAAPSPATVTATQIAHLSVTPDPLSYPGPQVTVTGVLETVASPPQPLAKRVIDLTFSYGDSTTTGVAVTGSHGTFSWRQPAVVPGSFTARFEGWSGYNPSAATVHPKAAQVYPARIVLRPVAPAAYRSRTTVTGTVQMRLPGRTWVPAPYAPVAINGGRTLAWTGANGGFAVPFYVDPALSQEITTQGSTGTYWWSGQAVTPRVVVPLTAFPTWMCHSTGTDVRPSPIRRIGVGSGACYLDSNGAAHNYSGAEAHLYYQAPSARGWRLMATTRTSSDGLAHVIVSGYLPGGKLAAGKWKWVVPPAVNYLGTRTRPFGIHVTVPTFLRWVRVAHARLTGRLSDRPGGGPVAGARLLVQRLVRGHWRRAGSVRTGARGRFRFRLRRRAAGRYRVCYRGGRLPGAQARYGRYLRSVSAAVRFR